MPLPIAPKRCGCGNDLDQYGDHRGACATTGALAATAPALETAVARSCREAGGRVARNVAVANMNIASPITDGRRIEIVANGLQAYHGQQLAIDTTCVSPISRAGFPHSGTTSEPRRAVAAAVARKRRRYPELLAARSRCRLLVFGVEVGGRWGVETRNLVRHLATQRSQDASYWLRAAACAGWIARWTGIVAVATETRSTGTSRVCRTSWPRLALTSRLARPDCPRRLKRVGGPQRRTPCYLRRVGGHRKWTSCGKNIVRCWNERISMGKTKLTPRQTEDTAFVAETGFQRKINA